MISIDLLKQNPANPRIIKSKEFKKLMESIKKFPQMFEKRPIVVEDLTNYVVLAGNQRVQALRELGYEEIPENWVMSAEDWTPDQKKEFMLKDNTHAGSWDWDMVNEGWDLHLGDWNLEPPKKKVGQKTETTTYHISVAVDTQEEADELLAALVKLGQEPKLVRRIKKEK